jgi:hypothetical protein
LSSERRVRPAYFTNFSLFSVDGLLLSPHEIKWKQHSGAENVSLLFSKRTNSSTEKLHTSCCFVINEEKSKSGVIFSSLR